MKHCVHILKVCLLLLCLGGSPAWATIFCPGLGDQLNMSGVTLGSTHSLAFWLYTQAATQTWGTIATAASGGFGMWYTNHGVYYTAGSGTVQLNAMTEPAWYHVAVVVTAGAASLYVNGSVVSSQSGFAGITFARICSDGSDHFKGALGAIAFYDVALNAGEIATLVQIGRRFYPGLSRQPVAYWTFDQCADGATVAASTAFVDRSGAGNTATVTAGSVGITCAAEFSYPWGPH